MNKVLIVLIFVLTAVQTLLSQEEILSIPEIIEMPADVAIIDTIYLNGKISRIDSIYNYGHERISKHFEENKKGLSSLTSKGPYLSQDKSVWTTYGLWSYWDKEGRLLYELFQNNGAIERHKECRYLNQTLPDGQQVLTEGNGYYIESPSVPGITDYSTNVLSGDSIVFQISNGIKTGQYHQWRRDASSEYYLAEKGQYGRFFRESQISYHPNGEIAFIMQYKNDEIHGAYHKFHSNGMYAEYGHFDKGVKIGNWKTWNEEGELVKDFTFAPWAELGDYYEFYETGQIKAIGTFGSFVGVDTVEVFDPDTYEYKMSVYKNTYSTGKIESWQYFDRDGNPIDQPLDSEK